MDVVYLGATVLSLRTPLLGTVSDAIDYYVRCHSALGISTQKPSHQRQTEQKMTNDSCTLSPHS